MATTEKDLKKVTKNLETINKKLSETTNKAVSEMSESYDSIFDRSKELYNILQKQKLLEEGINKLKADQVDYAKIAAAAKKDGNVELQKESVLLSKSAKYQIEQAERTKENLKRLYEITDIGEEQIKQQEKLTKLNKKYNDTILESLSFVDDITEKIGSIPVVGDVLVKALGADTLKEKLADKVTKALVGVSTAGISLIPILASIGAAFALIKFSVDIDKQTTTLARNLGTSKDNARLLRNNMADVEIASDNAMMTIANQTAAMEALTAESGTYLSTSKDLVKNQVILTNNLGLTSEIAAKLNTTFVAMGAPIEKTTDDIITTIGSFNKATKAGLNLKDVMSDISNVSSAIKGSFNGNIKALVTQVARAKVLGLTLNKIADIGRQSLEIESSIGTEMEARVLTGKEINLNAFRLAALNKDQNKMQEELSRQVGSFSEFNKLNVIAQDSLAKAFGLTTDEMSDMLQKQEVFKKLGVDIKDASIEQIKNNANLSEDEKKRLLNQKELSDVTDKMAKATESIQQIFAGMASTLQPVLDVFAGILKHTDAIKVIIAAVAGLIGGQMLVSMLQVIKAMRVARELSIGNAILAIIKGAWESVGPIPIVGAALAAGAAVAGIAYMHSHADSVNDGIIGPDGGLVVSGEKGTYQLHEDDTVIAGTGLGNVANTKSNSVTTSTPVSTDNSEVVALLKQLIQKVDQPTQVIIGNKVIDELETRTSLRKTYNTKVDHGYGVFG